MPQKPHLQGFLMKKKSLLRKTPSSSVLFAENTSVNSQHLINQKLQVISLNRVVFYLKLQILIMKFSLQMKPLMFAMDKIWHI